MSRQPRSSEFSAEPEPRPGQPTPIRTDLPRPEEESHTVPSPLTSFVGRGRELAEIRRLLGETRLLTLTGTGGVGKTRLALELAQRIKRSFADGIWVVELAALSDPELVPRAVAATAGVPEQPGIPVTETLVARFRRSRALLLLDNCEHLVTACAALAGHVLMNAPNLRILATSRQPLGVAGEMIWLVPSLSLPDSGGRADGARRSVADVLGSEAVRLFEERAKATAPAFRVGERSAGAVAEICRRLDGIPLAIELAAARVRALTPEQIADRLDDRLRLLARGRSAAVPRQRTLRASIDWSYDLLADDARALLRQTSVFAGGWTLEAAEGVCGADTVDLLADLVDASLVAADLAGGAARYRLLETIRVYAAERLRDEGEDLGLRRRHRDWFLDFAEVAAPALEGPDQANWLDQLEADHDNLRAALRWSIEERDTEAALRLGLALFRFWLVRDYLFEGLDWMESLINLAGDEVSTLVANARLAAGRLAQLRGRPDEAERHHRAGLEIATRLDYAAGVAAASTQLGWLARERGDHAAARSLYERSVRLRRELNQPRALGIALNGLARTALLEGKLQDAHDLAQEALVIHGPRGHRVDAGSALLTVADVAVLAGDPEAAAERFAEALEIGREIGDRTMICNALEGLAELAVPGEPEHALRLAGAAAAIRESTGASPHYAERPVLRAALATMPGRLGQERREELWVAGRADPIEKAVERALERLSARLDRAIGSGAVERGAIISSSEPASNPAAMELLTGRERQVAALVACGYTNRQVGAKLVISELTAETHVRNVLRKLGFSTRAQIAAWAAEHGLRAPE